MKHNPKEIRTFILGLLDKKFKRLGFTEKHLLNDFDLIQSGLLDSMQFLELIADIEEHFNTEIDFDTVETSQFTRLSNLINLLSETINR